ncbi:methyltransferase domain-containing protein [Salinibacterium sp. G-O1]|uniref:class I SAM-dependent methyltransferase n=1 Tax=Salinibacterium sp. G-O1 TaxID=3046208 RepID=UPI0024BB3409|nr:methyltransferase domain-containing protein [Salinibacterium sp. G-O1]MDJ0335061.1 methyltransferase domain-containing protein [Salinibacterium sp. G-O1]
MTFDELLAEGESVDVDGWDFSWFHGRATEQRTSWGYATMASARLSAASASLDIETGGAEVYSFALNRAVNKPDVIAATEAWPPNLAIARARLAPLGGSVAEVANDAPLPYEDETFDVVMSRLPTITPWTEIARVLRPGGTFLSQQVGHGTNRDLYEFMMGPQWVDPVSTIERLETGARAAGLAVVDLRQESPRLEFFDVAAVVVFLRKVIWTVPDFSAEKYRDRLRAMHEHIAQHGSFVSRGERAFIEARK